jgi:hypothetical protein
MLKEAEIHRGEWVDPDHAGISFGNYARQWLEDRVLKVRTRELYEGLLRNHLYPAFGNLGLPDIDEAAVRRWRKERLDSGRIAPRKFGPVTSQRRTGSCMRFSKLRPMTISSDVIRAGSKVLARKNPPSERSSRFLSYSLWPTLSRFASERWCCWRLLAAFAGASWSGFAARTSTWTRRRPRHRDDGRVGPRRSDA